MGKIKHRSFFATICVMACASIIFTSSKVSAFNKEESQKLAKCAEAHMNLSKLSKELSALIWKARKGAEVKLPKIMALEKEVDNWMGRVDERCTELDEILRSSVDKGETKIKILTRCYREFEDAEDDIVKKATKEIRGANFEKQKEIMAFVEKQFKYIQKSLGDCIEKNFGPYQIPYDDLLEAIEDSKQSEQDCWEDCVERCSEDEENEVDVKCYESCTGDCEKKGDADELKAMKDYINANVR